MCIHAECVISLHQVVQLQDLWFALQGDVEWTAQQCVASPVRREGGRERKEKGRDEKKHKHDDYSTCLEMKQVEKEKREGEGRRQRERERESLTIQVSNDSLISIGQFGLSLALSMTCTACGNQNMTEIWSLYSNKIMKVIIQKILHMHGLQK